MSSSPSPSAASVCELTGVGRGGVATVAVWADTAVHRSLYQRCLQPFFQPARQQTVPTPGAIVYGNWHSAGRSDEHAAGESVVVTAIDAQHIQVHCHGGRAAVESIVSDIASTGARRCDWPEWLAACGTCKLETEARQVLAATTTRRTAAIAYDQVRGAMREAAGRWIQTLQADPSALAAVHDAIRDVLAWESLGRHLSAPWRIVLAGAPNVGKSSLLNALLGYRRAITFDQPGTTRDVVSADTVLNSWPVTLSDTAGLRDAGDTIENQGVQRARGSIDQADLVLWVLDAADPSKTIADPSDGKPCLIVQNKVDLLQEPPPGTDSRHRSVAISATTGHGIEELIQNIIHSLVPATPPAGQPIPITARQVDCLRDALEASEGEATMEWLQRLLEPHCRAAVSGAS